MALSAVIFPGQGSQSVGMARDAFDRSAGARSIFERANELLGFDLSALCFEGPAARLEQTDLQQPAIFTASAALWEAFLEAGGTLNQFSYAAGLSLGEYTALYAAGCLTFDNALRLVRRRGELMQEAAEAIPSGMVSLLGADESTARALCEKARESGVLAPANFNCPGQIVIAGDKAACARAVALAGSLECRAIALAVAGAFHTSIMEPAAQGLAEMLNATPFQPAKIPVIANVNADYHAPSASSIRDFLRKQLTGPVLWQRCIERLAADGVTRFVEVGPGRVLTGLLRKINRDLTAVNVSTFDGIGAALPAGAPR